MEEYFRDSFDVAVIGAGHAGVEAGLAAARLGAKTGVFTISLDAIGNMPCNPSIGGTAKGHLVRELDALGGEMGKAADATFLQSRMLNRGKGPAVYSLRVQSDRVRYHDYMKNVMEHTDGLFLHQAEVAVVRKAKNGYEIVTSLGEVYTAVSVVIASGVYLKGRIYVGEASYEGAPDGHLPAKYMSESLTALGITLRRFKTGTPARVHKRSIDFSQMEAQPGDEHITPFSFDNHRELHNTEVCHIAYTNEKTHKVILENLSRSPLYSGKIEGVGPRYCPSIEDKVVRFRDKPRHQLFVEPMGEGTDEMYLQGMSSSLPVDVQEKMYRTIKGLEHVEIMRNAYAIEYDCCDPTELSATLGFKEIAGLFGAGQFNGTSGYEEAAVQGFVAGVNAARYTQHKEPFVLSRSSSYIGTLIDDIVTKGCSDPYRMMTSRSEYRLLLRQDNADERLTKIGYELGLISKERYAAFIRKYENIAHEIERLSSHYLVPSPMLNKILTDNGSTPVSNGISLSGLIKRPGITYEMLCVLDPGRPTLTYEEKEEVEIKIKYEGYIAKQLLEVEKLHSLEKKKLACDMDYSKVRGLRLEAMEKLNKIKPLSVGQASGISGVSPADISVLLIWLEHNKRSKKDGI